MQPPENLPHRLPSAARRIQRQALRLWLAVLLSICSVGPRFIRPEPKMPADYASRSSNAIRSDAAWWRRLNDSTANSPHGS
jgi:hypothetical protein